MQYTKDLIYILVNTTTPPCVDKISHCNEYDADLCTNPLYRLFREDNCQQFCGLCKTGGKIRVIIVLLISGQTYCSVLIRDVDAYHCQSS